MVNNLINYIELIPESLDSGGQVDVICTDFKKAFDNVNHKILIEKLNTFRISDSFINLIRSYLQDRLQNVCYNGFRSEINFARSGAPQGSKLGRLSFTLFINDITKHVDSKFSYKHTI